MSADGRKQSGNKLYRNFRLENEDHTMGTLLTYILNRMPETEFCSYTIRHPTETQMFIRLNVKEGNDVNAVFEKGLIELKKALEIIENKFKDAVDSFNEDHKDEVGD